MPSNSKPRKAYRPRPIGKPMGAGLGDKLVLIPHVAVARLISDQCDGEDAHSLLAFLNVAYRVYEKRGKPDQRGKLIMDAMLSMKCALDRDEDAPKVTAAELQIIKTGVTVGDNLISGALSHEVAEAISFVWEKVHERETY
jgi:hypothetical protein